MAHILNKFYDLFNFHYSLKWIKNHISKISYRLNRYVFYHQHMFERKYSKIVDSVAANLDIFFRSNIRYMFSGFEYFGDHIDCFEQLGSRIIFTISLHIFFTMHILHVWYRSFVWSSSDTDPLVPASQVLDKYFQLSLQSSAKNGEIPRRVKSANDSTQGVRQGNWFLMCFCNVLFVSVW